MKSRPPQISHRLYVKRVLVYSWLLLAFAASVPAAEREVLRGHVPAAVLKLNLQPIGRLPATTNLFLLIGLPLRNPAAVTNLLAQLYDPISPQYHHWLTPDQIAQQFGPTEQDYQGVIAYVKANGLTVTTTHADRTLLRVQGAVVDIEKMLHVALRVYQHPTEARTFYAPDVEPSIDLAVPLLHISGLDNFNIPHPGAAKGTPSDTQAGDGRGSGPSGGYWGYDFRSAYVSGVSLTGSGQVVGLLELDAYYRNDITAYEASNGLPNVTLTNVLVDGFPANPGTNLESSLEVPLDIEVTIAMAPGLSKLYVYEAPNNGSDWLDVLKQMQEDNVAKQLSSSWFVFNDTNADTYYQEFAMQGQSFFQCSGDKLAYHPGVGQWADAPYITIAGGTMLTTTGAESWVSETSWNNGNGTNGSGGGISASFMGDFSIPSWQQGVSMALNGGSTTMRDVPDVAMVAHNVYTILNNGGHTWAWGTSIAAPLWAGFTALVNEQAVTNGQPTVGFLNPALYAIGQGPNYTNCFHDVTTGNNTNSGSPSAYFATNGYDLCTGWGTPNGINLINALMPYSGAVWVDFNYTGGTTNGTYNAPFKTLAQGIAAVSASGNIWIKTAGSSPETPTISKPMTIRAYNGAASVGN